MKIKAVNIIKKIKQLDQGIFVANGNKELTDKINQIIIQNSQKRQYQEIKSSDTKNDNFEGGGDILYSNYNSEMHERLNICINENYIKSLEKVVTNVVPEKTRLHFIKKCINKLIKVFTRQQVEFNQSVVEYIKSISEKMNLTVIELSNSIITANENAVKLQNISDTISEIENKTRGEFNTNDKFSLLNSDINYLREKLEELCRINEINIKSHESMNQQQISIYERHEGLNNKYETINKKFDNLQKEYENISEKYNLLQQANNILTMSIGIIQQHEQINSDLFNNINDKIKDTNETLSKRIVDENNLALFIDKKYATEFQGVYSLYDKLRDELFYELTKNANNSKKKAAKEEIITNFKKSYYDKVEKNNGKILLNVGSGPFDKEGFINVDMRELKNIDIICDIKELPFKENEVSEILASHVVEHFTQFELVNNVIPEWKRVLKVGGAITIIVPNIAAMAKQYASSEISFESLAKVIMGGQEYEGNFHFSVFDEKIVLDILNKVGFSKIEVIELTRLNGGCLELEIKAYK